MPVITLRRNDSLTLSYRNRLEKSHFSLSYCNTYFLPMPPLALVGVDGAITKKTFRYGELNPGLNGESVVS